MHDASSFRRRAENEGLQTMEEKSLDPLAGFVLVKRTINPNSLLGLAWRLMANRESLDGRINGLKKKLLEHGISTDALATARDVAALLRQRRANGHNQFVRV
jgi:hypothetical protein